MHIEFCPGRSATLNRAAHIFLRQLLETVVNILWHQAALFDPTFLSAICTDAQEALLFFEHFDAITSSGYSVSVFTRWGETVDQVETALGSGCSGTGIRSGVRRGPAGGIGQTRVDIWLAATHQFSVMIVSNG